MMPMPFYAMALLAAHRARSADEAPAPIPSTKTARHPRASLRLVWSSLRNLAQPANTPHFTHTKER
jgi:hypothetical protein